MYDELAADRSIGAEQQELVLPGNIQAFIDAPIYARTNGYLKKWYVDIGTKVKEGQLLAEIETPEIDAQLHQGTCSWISGWRCSSRASPARASSTCSPTGSSWTTCTFAPIRRR